MEEKPDGKKVHFRRSIPTLSTISPIDTLDGIFVGGAACSALSVAKILLQNLGIDSTGFDDVQLIRIFEEGAKGAAIVSGCSMAFLSISALAYHRALNSPTVDYLSHYGVDMNSYTHMPMEHRISEIDLLTEIVNDEFRPVNYGRKELAKTVNDALTDYIAGLTGVRVETSSRTRKHGTIRLVLSSLAGGWTNTLNGEVYIFGGGVLEPHFIAHEFAHRKKYFPELEAQIIAYFSLINSGNSVLIQAANCERLGRNMQVFAGESKRKTYQVIEESKLRAELKNNFTRLYSAKHINPIKKRILIPVLKEIVELRMRLTGQKGVTDYSKGFTDFLYSAELSAQTR